MRLYEKKLTPSVQDALPSTKPSNYALSYDINDKTGKVIFFSREENGVLQPSAMLLDNGNQLEDIKDSINVLTNAVKAIPTTITASASSGGGSVVTNVTVGESFSVYASMEISQTGTYTDGGVTCVNNDSQDGYIKLSGTITTRGSKEYLLGGTKVVINAVDVPNGSNVVVVLD